LSETLPIWRDAAFHADEWTRLAPEAELPAAGEPLLAPLAAFLAEPQKFLGYNGRLGVEVSSGESVRPLEPHLARLSLVAVNFPKFHDGRGYSAVRLLRERYTYQGEIRATGDVLADQIPLMRRCGVTSYEVRNAPTRAALEAGRLAEVRHYYQPIPTQPEAPAGTRPWLRQPAT
jgi:phosphoadenosine phosphosulfate reductase